MAAKTKKLSDADWSQAFARSFGDLSGTVRGWVEAQAGWTLRDGSGKSETITNPDANPAWGNPFEFDVPPLRVRKAKDEWNAPPSHTGGTLVLEPTGRDWAGREVATLYAWPTLYRVRIVRSTVEAASEWKVFTESGIPWRREWNEENFVLLVHDLLAAGN